MVVHEDNEIPAEMAVARKPVFEAKNFVIVENHVRELPNNHEHAENMNVSLEKVSHNSENQSNKSTTKQAIKFKKNKNKFVQASSEESDDYAHKSTEIDVSDLEELKTVYERCKKVLTKIESKYGHLLDIEHKPEPSSATKRSHCEENCHCTPNKKIVFDDDGKQSTIDNMVAENHICPKKLKKTHSEPVPTKNIQIVYYENEITLPDDLQELSNILRSPDLETTYRNKVVEKLRLLKQEHANEIKFNKHSLIEKIKTNPDDLLDFKGTNLSSLPGYL